METKKTDEEKSGYVFYETFYEAIKDLPDETKLRFYNAITEYGLFHIEPDFEGLENAVWLQMRYSIDKAQAK